MIVVSGISDVLPCNVGELTYENENIKAYLPNEEIFDRFNKRFVKKRDKVVIYALKAVENLLEEYNLKHIEFHETGVIFSNTFGGWSYVEDQLVDMYHNGLDRINPYVATAWFGTAAQGEISIKYGIKGYSKTICAGNLGGGIAMKHSFESLLNGKLKYVITGGAEAPNTKLLHRVLGDEMLLDGAITFFMEKEETALSTGRNILLKIGDVKIARKIDDSMWESAKQKKALLCNVGNVGVEEKRADFERIELEAEYKDLNLASLQIPYLISCLYKQFKGTGKDVFLNYKSDRQVISMLLTIV